MVVSLVVGALASTAAISGSAKVAGLSATGLAGAAGLAGKAAPHAGLVAASLQPHLAPFGATPYASGIYHGLGYGGYYGHGWGYVPYYYNHTWYGSCWAWPYYY